jgi:ankyrin repeat protein
MGWSDAVKALLGHSDGADINHKKEDNGYTALFRAVEENRPEVIQILINEGAGRKTNNNSSTSTVTTFNV